MEQPTKPNPGSEEAIKLGCCCARIDNHYSQGVPLNGERVFWINGDCPLHGQKEES